MAEGSEARAAVEAVARHFGGILDVGPDGLQALLAIGERRTCLYVATFAPSPHLGMVKPRLRFDKVVIRLVKRLRDALSDEVPAGATVVFTLAAPIRLAAKTAAALEAKIRLCLEHGPDEFVESIHGNLVRVCLVSGGPRPSPKVVGFVHSPGADPRLLIEMSQALLQLAGRPSKQSAEERWLVLANPGAAPLAETWRMVKAQLSVGVHDARVIVVSPDGSIEDVSD